MSALVQMSSRNPFESSPGSKTRIRTMAVLSETGTSPKSSRGESQDTSPSTSMGPPQNNSPEAEPNGNSLQSNKEQNGPPIGAAAVGSSQSTKVVQTAFIHKLYNMLEDQSIKHLISWSNTNDSFVMSPTNEFSKVLAQYFKHTNISSFVRQLNMYGFHKVNDVFHTGSPESALWEFRHGNGSFRKGDLSSLREIKRRASRHTLIHRDSFTNPKAGPSQPGTPQEIAPESDHHRLAQLEHMVYGFHDRLIRSEEGYSLLSSRCQTLTDNLIRCHSWIQGIYGTVSSLAPQDAALRADIGSMQQEIARQLDHLRSLEQTPDHLTNGTRPLYPTNMTLDPPLSPRGYGFSESRRSSIQMQEPPPFGGSRPPIPPIPPQFSSPRGRFGSIGGPQSSPSFSRPPPPPPQQPHPLSNVVSPSAPNLARRHTSADIREHGWPIPNNGGGGSPYASGQSSVQWPPSSPQQGPSVGDQQIRDQLASYEINGPRRGTIVASNQDPPPSHAAETLPPPSGLGVENVSWSLNSKFPRSNFELHSAPGTRRSSMASNVHSLLNPADTIERPDGRDDDGANEDRKRKRLE